MSLMKKPRPTLFSFNKLNKFILIFLFFLSACSSVPKYPQNACKIFGEKYLWYKSAKKSSNTYGVPIHIILAFVNKESGFNHWYVTGPIIGIAFVAGIVIGALAMRARAQKTSTDFYEPLQV